MSTRDYRSTNELNIAYPEAHILIGRNSMLRSDVFDRIKTRLDISEPCPNTHADAVSGHSFYVQKK